MRLSLFLLSPLLLLLVLDSPTCLAKQYLVVSTSSTREVLTAAFPSLDAASDDDDEMDTEEDPLPSYLRLNSNDYKNNTQVNGPPRILSDEDVALTLASPFEAAAATRENGRGNGTSEDEAWPPSYNRTSDIIINVGLIEMDEDDEDALSRLRNAPNVVRVEENVVMNISGDAGVELGSDDDDNNSGVMNISTQPTTLWNQDRIDGPVARDGYFDFDLDNTGKNVDIYILDTGVRGTHSDFGGRVEKGVSFVVGDNVPANSDCHSHGTAVASVAAGTRFGLAKSATIIPVKVADCLGSADSYALVRGITWAVQTAVSRRASDPTRGAVINLSISAGGPIQTLDDAVNAAVNNNVVVVVAAGNLHADACDYSPGRVPAAITVGGTSPDDSLTTISNYGSCVDVYAPGEQVQGAGNLTDNSTQLRGGTSIATPQVTAIAALILENSPNMSAAEVHDAVMESAVPLTPPSDDDCAGFVPDGGVLAQTPFAATRPRVPIPDYYFPSVPRAFVVDGNDVDMEFIRWRPEHVVPAGHATCVTFQVRVARAYQGAAPQYAPLRVAVATNPVPGGFANYLGSNCRNPDVPPTVGYVMEYGITFGQIARLPDDSQVLRKRTWMTGKSPVRLSLTTPTDLYISWTSRDDVGDEGGTALEFGLGTGLRRAPAVTPIIAVTESGAVADLRYFAFSTSIWFALEFTNVRACGAPVSPTDDWYDWSKVGVATGGDDPLSGWTRTKKKSSNNKKKKTTKGGGSRNNSKRSGKKRR